MRTYSTAGDSLAPFNSQKNRTQGVPQTLQFLDLTQGVVGGGGGGDPYGPMGGHNLSHAQSSHTLCGENDDCGPLALHPYCARHCSAKHITYESSHNCFTARDCWCWYSGIIQWAWQQWKKCSALIVFTQTKNNIILQIVHLCTTYN